MKIVDANILLYAYNSDAQHHHAARRWIVDSFNDSEPVGLPWISLLAFLRISTNPRAYPNPLAIERAQAIVEEWLQHPIVFIPQPEHRHWKILSDLLIHDQVRGPLVTDAHLAALAIEHGATLFSTDRDFARFSSLKFVNPLAE